jgi:hypothetical protein
VEEPEAGGIEALRAALGRACGDALGASEFLASAGLDEPKLIALLRFPVPRPFVEALAATPPWSERPRVLGLLCLNPATPRTLAQRLLPALYWRDLAEVARSPRVEGGVRARAEAFLNERLPDLRLGDKIALGPLATGPVLRLLLLERDRKIIEAALFNPRLTESELCALVQSGEAHPLFLECVAGAPRWRGSYATRLALVLQPRTPRAIALGQLSSLVDRDLRRIANHPGLPPLIRAAAGRVAAEGRRR